uniref:Uncharacterized protein n=1 Tax=Anguilla anguilla TaxID=7936 RepID=A0A0E9TBV5_ANGAN
MQHYSHILQTGFCLCPGHRFPDSRKGKIKDNISYCTGNCYMISIFTLDVQKCEIV